MNQNFLLTLLANSDISFYLGGEKYSNRWTEEKVIKHLRKSLTDKIYYKHNTQWNFSIDFPAQTKKHGFWLDIKEILRRSLGDHWAQFLRIKIGSGDQLVSGELGLIKKITVNDAAASRWLTQIQFQLIWPLRTKSRYQLTKLARSELVINRWARISRSFDYENSRNQQGFSNSD